jgi:tetratricopeptide (TPR) repeat protein
MTSSFDLISVFAVLIAAQTLWRLSQNWTSFWDDRVTWQDREIAQRLGVFILIPIGVLLHEVGHSLATWQVGGTVLAFQWRFYWGYILPSGNFSAAESWWISFSGNLVSIVLGLLPIAFIPYARKRIVGEVLYFFVCAELVYALIGYPILSFGLQGGDWVRIYDFSVQPYASLTLVCHIVLLWGLWQLYHSQKSIHWRLAVNSHTLSTWEKLKTDLAKAPNDLESNLELAYLLLQNNEVREAKKIAQQVYRLAPEEQRVRVLRLVIDYQQRAYRKAIQSSRQLLNTELSAENQLRIYRILSFSLHKLGNLKEALTYADLGLADDPDNYSLRCHRGVIYQALNQHQAAKADFDIALESAPDKESRQQLQQWLKRYHNHTNN